MITTQWKIITAGDMSADVSSVAVDLGGVIFGSIQSVFTGAPLGSLQLQISNDIVPVGADPNAVITHWDDYGSTPAVTAAGTYTFNISNMGYKWVRVKFIASGGSVGVLDSTVAAKNDND